jgi:predicted phage terminase large subunit-like protein
VRDILALLERFQLPLCKILIEEAANGAAVVETLSGLIPGVEAVPPRGSKEARAHASTIVFSNGNVYLPGAPEDEAMVERYIQEFVRFPVGSNDDQVDATSLYFDTQAPGSGFAEYERLAAALKVERG